MVEGLRDLKDVGTKLGLHLYDRCEKDNAEIFKKNCLVAASLRRTLLEI